MTIYSAGVIGFEVGRVLCTNLHLFTKVVFACFDRGSYIMYCINVYKMLRMQSMSSCNNHPYINSLCVCCVRGQVCWSSCLVWFVSHVHILTHATVKGTPVLVVSCV